MNVNVSKIRSLTPAETKQVSGGVIMLTPVMTIFIGGGSEGGEDGGGGSGGGGPTKSATDVQC